MSTTKSKLKLAFYLFWIKSSRGTDSACYKIYDAPQSAEVLKGDVEEWASLFGAWNVSENHVSYGYKKVSSKTIPKNKVEMKKAVKRAFVEYNACREKLRNAERKRNLLINLENQMLKRGFK